MINLRKLGRLIRALREKQQLTVVATAEKAGIGETTVHYIERGGNTTLENLDALCSALGKLVSDLIADCEEV